MVTFNFGMINTVKNVKNKIKLPKTSLIGGVMENKKIFYKKSLTNKSFCVIIKTQ